MMKLVLPALVFALGVFVGLAILPYHFSPQKMINPEELSGRFDRADVSGQFHSKTVVSELADSTTKTSVLGSSTSAKKIEVNLTNQRLYALENNGVVMEFPISSGLWGRTPTGTFRVWIKLRYAKMEGGNKALNTYYYLPNVPYTMYFSNNEVPSWRGYGIHGAYWHNNFGHPMSHGCINMRIEDAGKLYYWAEPTLGDKPSIRASAGNPGTEIIIYGKAPAN
jgi:lipoprotein-anchoring transpeptidase ErfK/SrfK